MCDFSQYGGPSEEWLKVEATMPELPQDMPLKDLVLMLNTGREDTSMKEMQALASQVTIKNYTIPTRDGSTIQARTYCSSASSSTDPLPVYVAFHGGGFLFGTIDSEDAACSRIIAAGVPCVVLNVNYRHTPEYTYPTAWNDSEDALDWLHNNLTELGADGNRIIVGGISAGAYLTASMTLRRSTLKDTTQPKIIGQILIIPCLVQGPCYDAIVSQLKDPGLSCYKENEFAPILPVSRIETFNKLLQIPAPINPNDRRLNPGLATADEIGGLPPTVYGIAGLDPLRDEGLLHAKLLAENGIPTDVTLFKGVPHGFRRFGDQLTASKHWDEVVTKGIEWILSQPQASGKFDVKVVP